MKIYIGKRVVARDPSGPVVIEREGVVVDEGVSGDWIVYHRDYGGTAFYRAELLRPWNVVEGSSFVRCAHCETGIAVCVGRYEDCCDVPAPACDECCGHGNEDGWCVLLDDHEDIVKTMLNLRRHADEMILRHDQIEALLDNETLQAADAKCLLYSAMFDSAMFGDPPIDNHAVDKALSNADEYALRAQEIRSTRGEMP